MSESIIAVLVLAAACWVLRVTFVLVPAEKLPTGIRDSLDHMAPAVLASLAAVEVTQTVRDQDLGAVLTTASLLILVGFVAFRWRDLTVTVGVALAGVAAVDLLLPLALST